jgi:hypothetical protein
MGSAHTCAAIDGLRVMDDVVATRTYQVMLLHRRFERDAVEAYVDRSIVGLGNARR